MQENSKLKHLLVESIVADLTAPLKCSRVGRVGEGRRRLPHGGPVRKTLY
jgi:hypothetical protein